MFAFNKEDSRLQTWSRISERRPSCAILVLFLTFTGCFLFFFAPTENVVTCETGIILDFNTFWGKTPLREI